MQETGTYLEELAEDTTQPEVRTVEDFLDSIENQHLALDLIKHYYKEERATDSGVSKGLDLEGIRSTLNTLIDFSESTISHDVINQFVYMITKQLNSIRPHYRKIVWAFYNKRAKKEKKNKKVVDKSETEW